MFLVEIMLYTLGSALMFGIIARRLRNGIYFLVLVVCRLLL